MKKRTILLTKHENESYVIRFFVGSGNKTVYFVKLYLIHDVSLEGVNSAEFDNFNDALNFYNEQCGNLDALIFNSQMHKANY